LTGYWLPHDAANGSDARYISNSDILAYLRSSAARHILVISDACFSGSIFINSFLDIDPLDFYSQHQRKSRWAMTSGNLTPVSDYGPDKKHSAFAHQLLTILNNTREPYLSPDYLTGEIGSKVWNHSKRLQLPRCGRLEGDKGGNFLFWNQEAVTTDGSPYSPPWKSAESPSLRELKRKLRGRQVWVTGGRQELCDVLEDLGLAVDCDLDWKGRDNPQEIGTHCGQIRKGTIAALRDYLNLNHYRLNTHEDQPEKFTNEECGQSFEIKISN